MKTWKFSARTSLGSLFALAMLVGPHAVSAETLRAASGSPPGHAAHDPMYTTFASTLEEVSGGAMNVQLMGTEVATLRGAISNLQGGILDVGNLLTLYFPAEFPNNMVVSELAVLGQSGQAMSGAVTEYLLSCEACLEEFTSKGLVYLGTGSTSSYQLLSNKPVTSVEDLRGLRVRSGGAPFTRFAEAMGLVPVEITMDEEYEAVASGLIDGLLNPPVNLLNGKLYEILKHVTELNIGTFHASSGFTVRQETWRRLSVEQRGQLMRAAIAGVAISAPGFDAMDAEALEHVEVHQPDAGLTEAVNAYRTKVLADAAKMGVEQYKVSESQAEIDRFARLVDKWNAIIAEIGPKDHKAMADRLYKEVFADIDLSTYGM
ncbi:C4-dicarboxylate TRAP transporter substrate-binding protein [Aminobacter sp. J44]|uniref:C4-dicarboxylate TRAP transporter substrate-binding protein n=1 Tax=Aminobacter sp. J44 TaxID=935262 RepID=UPI00119C628C|nr:C4-dicarboxylate TRAP transporter substrate-binding protein [Aminobacter sp. J44]TWG49532.1 TRAP-type C4-dicarboxylate transport system substrate-binding protein [Aminobacter sp. J44]